MNRQDAKTPPEYQINSTARQNEIRELAKTRPARGCRHVLWLMAKSAREIAYVRHPDRVGEEREHRRVVGRVADESMRRARRVEINAELVAHEPPGHGELVVGAEPAVDMDGAHFRGQAARLHQRKDELDGGRREPRV